MRSSISRVSIATLIFTTLVSGCTSIANINVDWLKRNCPSFPVFYAESCEAYSNCLKSSPTACLCEFDNGTYGGEFRNGKFHGFGGYDWKSGNSFLGHWINGNKSCGIESNSKSDYWVYKNGKVIRSGNNITNGIGAILVAGAVYAIADSNNGGGAKRYDSDWDWDWQPANATWVCRGITTGQYAELSNCQYDIKDDNRWPN